MPLTAVPAPAMKIFRMMAISVVIALITTPLVPAFSMPPALEQPLMLTRESPSPKMSDSVVVVFTCDYVLQELSSHRKVC